MVFPADGPKLLAVGGMPEPILNVGPDALPSLVVRGEEGVLLFVYDNPGKPLGQSEEIYFARWTGSTWTTHAPLTANMYPDTQPTLAFDSNGNAVAIWTAMPTVTGEETDPADILPKAEIAYSMYDMSVGNWSTPTQLTINTYTDCLPTLARGSDGSLTAFWLASVDDSIPSGRTTSWRSTLRFGRPIGTERTSVLLIGLRRAFRRIHIRRQRHHRLGTSSSGRRTRTATPRRLRTGRYMR